MWIKHLPESHSQVFFTWNCASVRVYHLSYAEEANPSGLAETKIWCCEVIYFILHCSCFSLP